MRFTRYAAILSVALLSACGSTGASTDEGTTGDQQVRVANIAYQPDRLQVAVGDTVTWTSEDEGVHHTVTSGEPAGESIPGVSKGAPSQPDGTFNGDLADAGSSFTFTFTDAGTYAYFCEVHPSMTAQIVVR